MPPPAPPPPPEGAPPPNTHLNPAPLPRHPSPHRGREVGARFAPPWLSDARCTSLRAGDSASIAETRRASLRTSGNAPRVGCIRQSQPWRIHPTRYAINPAQLPRHSAPHRGRVVGARFAPPWLSDARCTSLRAGDSASIAETRRASLRTSGNAPRVGCIRQSQPWRIHPTRYAINPAQLPRHSAPHRGRMVGARFAPP